MDLTMRMESDLLQDQVHRLHLKKIDTTLIAAIDLLDSLHRLHLLLRRMEVIPLLACMIVVVAAQVIPSHLRPRQRRMNTTGPQWEVTLAARTLTRLPTVQLHGRLHLLVELAHSGIVSTRV